MSLYIDGLGQYQSEYDALYQRFVPTSGHADTLQGELVRLIGKLADEFYRNGNINWNDDYRQMVRCLVAVLSQHFDNPLDKDAIDIYSQQIISAGETGICYYLDAEDQYDKMTDYVVCYCQDNPQPIANDCPMHYQYSI